MIGRLKTFLVTRAVEGLLRWAERELEFARWKADIIRRARGGRRTRRRAPIR